MGPVAREATPLSVAGVVDVCWCRGNAGAGAAAGRRVESCKALILACLRCGAGNSPKRKIEEYTKGTPLRLDKSTKINGWMIAGRPPISRSLEKMDEMRCARR